ncbi:MAG: glycosyltransferase [Desulfuromonadales bacterium]|nr:glycosyltransferase [Desulfuromonadales bacterium]
MKILFVSLFLPQEKAYHAGGRYVFELLRQLSQRHEIHLATRLQDNEYSGLEELRPFCREIYPYSYPAREKRGLLDKIRLAGNYIGFSRFADRLIRDGVFDLVQVEWVETALCIRRGRIPMVLDAHDVISKPAGRAMNQKTGLGRIIARLRCLLVRSVEKKIMGRFTTIFTMSEYDRNYLHGMLPGVDARTVPIPAGLDIGDRSFEREANTLLFLASYRYRPVNVAAALWFCREVLPLVRQEVPDARFIIAGYGPPVELTALAADPLIEVPGFVDDLEACYKGAAVFVAPILQGGGIIVKILDALAAGTPVVTTTFGNEGIGGTPGRDLLVADDPQAFAAAVIAILRDPGLAERLTENGRAFVAEHYGLDAVLAKIETIYGELVRKPGSGNRKDVKAFTDP